MSSDRDCTNRKEVLLRAGRELVRQDHSLEAHICFLEWFIGEEGVRAWRPCFRGQLMAHMAPVKSADRADAWLVRQAEKEAARTGAGNGYKGSSSVSHRKGVKNDTKRHMPHKKGK